MSSILGTDFGLEGAGISFFDTFDGLLPLLLKFWRVFTVRTVAITAKRECRKAFAIPGRVQMSGLIGNSNGHAVVNFSCTCGF